MGKNGSDYMTFADVLNKYLDIIHCSARELAEYSGLSAGTISRYRSGQRVPEYGAQQIDSLAEALTKLAEEHGVSDVQVHHVRSELSAPLLKPMCGAHLTTNLNTLVSLLELNLCDLARALHFDPSFLSRVCAGQRRPAEPEVFATEVGRYIARRGISDGEREALSALLGSMGDKALDEAVRDYLLSEEREKKSSIDHFLHELDEFDISEFLRTINFNSIHTPLGISFRIPVSRFYYGVEQYREALMLFFRMTLISRSREPIFLFTEMPIADIASDQMFTKRWIYAAAVILKRNIHLRTLHDVNRPLDEMMLGLEAWMPLYMTGLVTPYYLKEAGHGVFQHLHCVSGAAALEGSCIEGHHNTGRYYLSNTREDIEFARQRADEMVQRAKPLVEIYTSERSDELEAFLLAEAGRPGTQQNLLSSPPAATLDEELLDEMLTSNGVDSVSADSIRSHVAQSRKQLEAQLVHGAVHDKISLWSETDWDSAPPALALSEVFYTYDITYTPKQYARHIELTHAFSASHPGYTVTENIFPTFGNIQVQTRLGKWVLVSKNKSPSIHFVFRHPKIVRAFERLIPFLDDRSILTGATKP